MLAGKNNEKEPKPTRPSGDPNLPRPDAAGSGRGGLIFVSVVFGLILIAILTELFGG